jgi:hypothetical protein
MSWSSSCLIGAVTSGAVHVKVNFAHSRAKSAREQGGDDVKAGGFVEVFENQADALARGA